MTDYDNGWPIQGPGSPPLSPGGRNNWSALQEWGPVNQVLNNDFAIWPASSLPAWWRSTGSPTVSRTGIGETEPERRWGRFAVEVAASGAEGVLEQRVVQGGSIDTLTEYFEIADIDDGENQDVSLGCYIYTPDASQVNLSIFDGVDETETTLLATTSTWVWQTLSHTINESPTELTVRLKVNDGASGIFSGPTLFFGPVPPRRPMLPTIEYKTLPWSWEGEVATGDDALGIFNSPGLPALVLGTRLYAGVAPTDADIVVQLAKNGTADIYDTTFPTITATNQTGGLAANGTYENRCLDHNDRVHLDIDNVGSTEEGEDLQVWVRCAMPTRPLLSWVDFEEGD